MKILIIRHGETDWNCEKRLQGRTDIELNDTGRKQAFEAKKMLDKRDIDLVVCSPLKRARETASIIVGERNIPIICDDRVMERSFGDIEGSLIKDIDLSDAWELGGSLKYDGMESSELLMARITDFLNDMYSKYSDKTILVVTHGAVTIGVGCYFNGYGDSKTRKTYFCDNCVVKEYDKV